MFDIAPRISAATPTMPGGTRVVVFILFLAVVLTVSCGGGTSMTDPLSSSQPTFSHVVLVVEENHSYSEVIGSSDMPYLNGLAQQYGLAAQSYATAHPSLPNYLMLTTGMTPTFDDGFSGTISSDNVVRELVKAGKSWKCYAENLPSPGYTGSDAYPYVRDHDPFTYFVDVLTDPAQAANVVPFSDFAADLANDGLPQYSFVIPSRLNDAHDGTLAQADAWLQANIGPLLANSAFQSNGLLIITFDESEPDDVEHGGGHIATVIVSSRSKKGFVSTKTYLHQSVLRLTLEASGVTTFPGAAAEAPDMSEFFQ